MFGIILSVIVRDFFQGDSFDYHVCSKIVLTNLMNVVLKQIFVGIHEEFMNSSRLNGYLTDI